MTQKLQDHDTQKIIYRSAVGPQKSSTPNHRLAPPLGSSEGPSLKQKTPTVFIRSRDKEHPSGSKYMPIFDPEDLIGRTFLLPPEENGKRHRAKVTRKVAEIIDTENGYRVENIHFILDIGNGKVEELIPCNKLLQLLETAQDNDLGMDQELV